MPVTIKEVAEAANVSASTVSRVLSNNPKISQSTKDRVMDVINKLNYHPNILARSLASSNSKIIGLIIPNTDEDLFKNPFFIQIMTGISIYSKKLGYNIMYNFSDNEEEEVKLLNSFTNSKLVEGIILLTSRNNDRCIEYLKKRDFPFAVVGRPEMSSDILWVDNDNFQAMYNVAASFIKNGHTSIAFIGGQKEMNMSKDRYEGYAQALQTHGIPLDESITYHAKDFSEYSGAEAMIEILKSHTPTAVVTTDDLLAFGALKVLSENSVSGIKVSGFNDTPFSVYQCPPLSSVNINAEKLGYFAAKLLIAKLENEELPVNHYIIETKFIERASTL